MNGGFIPTQNMQTQNYMNNISDWTDNQKMKISVEKSKIMLFNFTKKYQFSTRIYMNNQLLDIVNETRLLGYELTADLTTRKNTECLVKKGFQRMIILHKLY